MKPRVEAWLRETHGSLFELFRHFLGQFFESDPAGSGGWLKLSLGFAGFLPITWPVLFLAWQAKYIDLLQKPSAEAFRRAVRQDQMWLIAVAMCVTAVLTSIQWQALFPTRRDLLAMNSLPLEQGEIFLAKFGSLTAIFGAFVLALTVIPSYAFAVIVAGRWQENQSSIANALGLATSGIAACSFVFFGMVGLQGILLNLLPARWFHRVSLYIQGLLFVASLASVPYLGHGDAWWWPPAWFLDIWASMTGVAGTGRAGLATISVAAALVAATGSYLLSYGRFQRVLLEAPAFRTAAVPKRHRMAAMLLDWWIHDPREQAMFVFLWKALTRSRSHRLVLLGYAGIGLGWILRELAGWTKMRESEDGIAFLILWTAVTLSAFVFAGLRYLFSLPVDVGANWAFRLTEREGKASWLRALERFVLWCGAGPILLLTIPAVAVAIGWARAAAALLLAVMLVSVFFEVIFQSWCKAPFACAHQAARKPLLVALLPYIGLFWLLAPVCAILVFSTGYVPLLAGVAGILAVWWRKARRERWRVWTEMSLLYEEDATDVQTLGLGARCASHLEEGSPAELPQLRSGKPIFAESLLQSGSAGTLERLEEILQDRDRPRGVRPALRALLEDVGSGLHLARKSPAVSAVVALTLALGIGMNAIVFTVLNATVLRPAVYRNPGNFAMVFPYDQAVNSAMPGTYEEFRAFSAAHSLRSLAASSRTEVSLADNDRRGAVAILVSCNFFAVNGLERARSGRLFAPEDCAAPGAAEAAILTEQTWRDRFAADPQIVGKVVHIDRLPFTVIGIVPTDASGWTERAELWLPFTAQPQLDPARNQFAPGAGRWLTMAARLAPGVSRPAAQAELTVIAQQLRPGGKSSALVTDGSWMESPGFSQRALLVMILVMGALTLVLLTSCANVITILLSRAAGRQRELAVRLSLGAPRIRILRMLLTESMLLACIAGGISMWLVYHGPEALYRFLTNRAPNVPLTPDWRIFAYTGVIVAAMGLLSGVMPALESLRADLTESLKGHVRFSPGISGGGRLRDFLVSAQVAFSLALLVAAGGFGRAQLAMLGANPGYETRRLLVAQLRVPPRTPAAAAATLQQAVAAAVQTLPGVRSVAWSNNLPMSNHNVVDVRLPGGQSVYSIQFDAASPRYFETLGIPILRGREFQQADADALYGPPEGSVRPPVAATLDVVISEGFARRFWPGEDPVGKRLEMNRGTVQVIGVARDIQAGSFGGTDLPAAWWLSRQNVRGSYLMARMDAPTHDAVKAIREAVSVAAPDSGVDPRPLQSYIDDAARDLWNVVSMAGFLGLVAIMLAVAGIYGSVRFSAAQRTQEMGIRVALGAQRLDIAWAVLVSGGRPVLMGMLAGLWIAMGLAATIRSAFRGASIRVDASDPLIYAAAAALLGLAALLAMAGPARRAATSDPLEALRAE